MHNIHINLEDTNDSVSSTFILWADLPSSIIALLNDRRIEDDRFRRGKCNMAVTGLAILVEGFITDLLASEVENTTTNLTVQQIQNLNTKATWGDKKKYFKIVFSKELHTFQSYQTIEILFTLRNNVAHGRTYAERITYLDASNQEKKIPNDNYNTVREYIIKLRDLQPKANEVSPYFPWTPDIIIIFFSDVRTFLYDIVNNTPIIKKTDFLKYLDDAYRPINP